MSEYPGASMHLPHYTELRKALENAINEYRINKGVETGTYLGLGSTSLVGECLEQTKEPSLITIESNENYYMQAKENLKRFPFIECKWGLSLKEEEARNFLNSDISLINHKNIDNVFIDDINDPVAFYLNEISTNKERPENLLENELNKIKDDNPLIILDSAGGMGYLEWLKVKEIMQNRQFILLLDDINHVKHYRSMEDIKSDTKRYKILSESERWSLTYAY